MTPSTRRLPQLLRACGALLAAAALLVGVPALLLAAVGNPLPETVPTIDEIRVVLTQSGDGFAQFVLSALAIVIWFLWIQFVLALIVETFATLRKRPTPQLPTLPGIQGFAAKLIATITLAATLAATPLAPAIGALSFGDLAASSSAPTSVATSVHSSLATNWTSEGEPSSDSDDLSTTPAPDDAQAQRVTLASHTELWDLAEAAYGDGTGWKIIVAANVGGSMSDGSTIGADTQSLPAGTSVTIPGTVDLEAVHALNASTVDIAVSSNGGESTAGTGADAHTVVQGESMWSIAQDRVGGESEPGELADYWHQVVDENSDVASGDVDLIHPGDELRLPPIAPTASAASAVSAATANGAAEFQLVDGPSGSRSTSISDEIPAEADEAPVADEVEQLSEAAGAEEGIETGEALDLRDDADRANSVDVEPSGEAQPEVSDDVSGSDAPSTQGDLIEGFEDIGDVAVEEPAGLSVAGVAGRSDAAPTPAPQVSRAVAADDERVAVAPAVVAGLGAALVAAGIVGALRRRRALQWRMRAPATLPLQPSTEAAAFEAVLAHAAAQISESELGNNWQALPLSALGPVHAAAQVHAYADGRLRVVSLDDLDDLDDEADANDLTAASDHTAADGEGDGVGGDHVIDLRQDETGPEPVQDPKITVWKADGSVSDEGASDNAALDDAPEIDVRESTDLPAAAAERSSVSVVVGTDLTDGSAVLLDLAAGSTVDLAGEHHEVCRFARSVVVDLATSDRSTDVQVIVVGHVAEVIDLERVHVVGSYPDAVDAVQQSGHAGGTSGTPVVIVATNTNETGGTSDSSSPSDDGHGDTDPDARDNSLEQLRSLGAIVAAPALSSADVQLEVSAAQVTVWPTGTIASTAALPDHGYRLVSELVDTTSLTAVEPVGTSQVDLDVPQVEGCSIEPGPVEVRVLGPVEIAGASSFSSTKAIDVVTYLAFHRNGVDADQLKTWVWPSFEPPTDKAFANVLSRARTGLGVDTEGSPYLSRAGADRTYRLDATVTTDFDRFRGLVDLADQCADQHHELDMLRQALELIRGVPFTGGTTTSFVWADNHVRAHVEFAIDEAVHRCADLALELGEVATARWAALKGLELVPGCEQCFRRRFLVASAANNRQELRRAMADLERTTAAELGEPEAVDLISRDLVALFDELDRTLMSGAT